MPLGLPGAGSRRPRLRRLDLTRRRFLQLLATMAAGSACGSPESTANDVPSSVRARRQLVMAVDGEPRTLVPSIGGAPGAAVEHLFDLVHQSLVTYDDQAQPIPRVARELPSVERGTWRIQPDGTMETTWQLRNDVRWHDGRPLTTEDIVFSWRVFNDAALPVVSRRVARMIDRVESSGPHTIVMHWRSRYAFADQLSGYDLTLLPSHLLATSFELRPEQISGHPYWRRAFVGLGPYRVAQWPSGSSLELEAFEDYFLGRPRVDEMSVRFIPDDNSAMAGVLSGNLDLLLPRRAVLGIVRTVRELWSDEREGVLSVIPGHTWAFLAPQFRGPQPEDLADSRIRQALAHAVDRAAIAEVVTGHRSLAGAVWLPESDPRYPQIAEGVSFPEYDPGRARDLFREAGWRREATDDVLVKQGRRFEVDLATTAEWERPAALVAQYWRHVGAAVKENVFSLSTASDRHARSTFSGVELGVGAPSLALLDGRLQSGNWPGRANQWAGANRGNYANPEVDGLLERIWASPDRGERQAAERELARVVSTELPVIGLFFYPAMAMVRRIVRNTRPPRAVAPVGRPSMTWNAHEWELQS